MFYKFFSLFLALFVCFPALARKDFSGPHVGGDFSYLYNRTDLNGQPYKGMSFIPKIVGGYGWVSSSLYYGIEGEGGYNFFSKKKGGERLTKNNFLGASLRFGQIIKSHFLPFIRLGTKYHHYRFQFQNRQRISFASPLITMGIGVDAFFEESWSLRSEIGWAWSLSTPTKKVSISKKPFELGITMGIAHHF